MSTSKTPGAGGNSVAVADVNGDGNPDLVMTDACISLNSYCTGDGSLGVLIHTALSVSPTSINFGNQTVGSISSPQSVTLMNGGSIALTISLIGITGANSNAFTQRNNCPSSVPVNGSCNINLTLTPVAAGSATASLTIKDSALGSPQTVSLTGIGGDPVVSLSPQHEAYVGCAITY